MPELVGIPQIAKRLGLDSTSVRRLIAREGDALKIQIRRGKSDRVLLTHDDAEKLIASYEARRAPSPVDSQDTATFDRHGYFYIIQLVPEAIPNRVKVGFADNVERRLADHRTAAPTAKLLKAWPCKRSWEFAATDSATRSGCKLVLNEVYEGDPKNLSGAQMPFLPLYPIQILRRNYLSILLCQSPWRSQKRSSQPVKPSNHSMEPIQPLALRLRRDPNFCFNWLGGLSLSR
jgi:hypothetical protein